MRDPSVRAQALTAVGAVESHVGRLESAEEMLKEALELERRVGDELSVADTLSNLGWVGLLRGAYDEARSRLEESLAIASRLDDDLRSLFAYGNLGLLELFEGRYEAAVGAFVEELRMSTRLGNRRNGLEALYGLAVAYAGLDDAALSVKIDGARVALAELASVRIETVVLERLDPLLEQARHLLAPAFSGLR